MSDLDKTKILEAVKDMFEQLGDLQKTIISLEQHINNIDSRCNELLNYLIKHKED